jgi:hypothetical protein
VNCTGEILKVAGENPGESWTLQAGESKEIETRSGLGLRAIYGNNKKGRIEVFAPNVIAIHPTN